MLATNRVAWCCQTNAISAWHVGAVSKLASKRLQILLAAVRLQRREPYSARMGWWSLLIHIYRLDCWYRCDLTYIFDVPLHFGHSVRVSCRPTVLPTETETVNDLRRTLNLGNMLQLANMQPLVKWIVCCAWEKINGTGRLMYAKGRKYRSMYVHEVIDDRYSGRFHDHQKRLTAFYCMPNLYFWFIQVSWIHHSTRTVLYIHTDCTYLCASRDM